ncbi:MAG: endonuclease domain-containing protein [Deltaproteobacteria bacterium]|jgi:very-short-patch-repair endonuclease|nr:endonuclease domain-containing protein [Deltaproteobacteria bacterium]
MTRPPDIPGIPESIVYPEGILPDEILKRIGGSGPPFVDARPAEWDVIAVLEAALSALASTALSEWPSWFETGESTGPSPLEEMFSYDVYTSDIFRVIHRAARVPDSDQGWLKAAVTMGVFRGNPPFFRNAPYELQLRQLPLVLRARYSILRIFQPFRLHPPEGGLTSFAKACEFLAGETGMRVAVIVGDSLKSCPELEPVMSRSRELPGPGEMLLPAAWPELWTVASEGARAGAHGPGAEEWGPVGPFGTVKSVEPGRFEDRGSSGETGRSGDRGSSGETGRSGDRGSFGEKGSSGETGKSGSSESSGETEHPGGQVAPGEPAVPGGAAGRGNSGTPDVPVGSVLTANKAPEMVTGNGPPAAERQSGTSTEGQPSRPGTFSRGLASLLEDISEERFTAVPGSAAGAGAGYADVDLGKPTSEPGASAGTAVPDTGRTPPASASGTLPGVGDDGTRENAASVSDTWDAPATPEHPYGGPFRPFWDIEGKPNPLSPGETRLAEHLKESPDLSGLFTFNVPVETVEGVKLMVDLLWEEGRLVVEIDGYTHHSTKQAFVADRERDFQLLLSGYRVLRIPHGEAYWSVADTLAKIRKVMDFIRAHKE